MSSGVKMCAYSYLKFLKNEKKFISNSNTIILFNRRISQNISNKHLAGYVTDSVTKEFIPFANIVIKDTATATIIYATQADSKGHYFFKYLPAGKFTLLVSAVGYISIKKEMDQNSVDSKGVNIKLMINPKILNAVVVSARRLDMQRMGELSEAVHPTTIITPDEMFMKNANTFTQAVASEPGVCVLTGCSSCGFKQIQINGLGANQTTMLS